MEELTIPAYGKINLFLNVKSLREDGYHNIETVMQSIGLHDNITISSDKEGIDIKTDSSKIPLGEENLAYKAAQAMIDRFKINKGVRIYIDKNIPVAAGLAGGSADAAAVIKGMNQLFNLKLKKEELLDIAQTIGSDVPFCLKGGTALATKRGEELKFLTSLKKHYVILVKPPQMVSTKKIYQLYDKKDIEMEIPVNKLIKIIDESKKMDLEDGWVNVFEPITKEIIPDIKEIENRLIDKGFKFTMMSGSGPTVFSLIKDKKIRLAKKVVDNWDRKEDFITLTKTIGYY